MKTEAKLRTLWLAVIVEAIAILLILVYPFRIQVVQAVTPVMADENPLLAALEYESPLQKFRTSPVNVLVG